MGGLRSLHGWSGGEKAFRTAGNLLYIPRRLAGEFRLLINASLSGLCNQRTNQPNKQTTNQPTNQPHDPGFLEKLTVPQPIHKSPSFFLILISSTYLSRWKGLLLSPITMNDTPHSVELWNRDQPDAQTSTGTTHNTIRDIRASDGIRNRNPSKRMAADPTP